MEKNRPKPEPVVSPAYRDKISDDIVAEEEARNYVTKVEGRTITGTVVYPKKGTKEARKVPERVLFDGTRWSFVPGYTIHRCLERLAARWESKSKSDILRRLLHPLCAELSHILDHLPPEGEEDSTIVQLRYDLSRPLQQGEGRFE